MKTKFFLKLSTLCAMMLLGSTVWATQYCNEELTALTVGYTDGNLIFTASKTGDLETTFVLTSTTSTLTGIYAGTTMQNLGGGATAENTTTEMHLNWSQEGNVLTKKITWTTYPTENMQLYLIAYRDNSGGGSDITGLTIMDIDVSAACSSSPSTDTIAPEMREASLNSTTYNSAVINVTAIDETTDPVTKFVVNDVTNSITDKVCTATDGKITLTGLSSGTEYNLTIAAKDAAGNVSANTKVVRFTTETLLYFDFATGHLSNAEFGDANGRILLTIQKESDSSVSVSVKPNNDGTIIDLLYVVLSGSVENAQTLGTENGTSIAGQKLTFTGLTSLTSLTFAPIQWHTTSLGVGGRWSIDNLIVAESELYVASGATVSFATKFPIVALYPNPVVDVLNISAENEIAQVEIRNVLGQVVKSVAVDATSATIDVCDLISGNYFVTVYSIQGSKVVSKMLK